MELLKQLCRVHAPSGNEGNMKEFIKNYVLQNQHTWTTKPEIIEGEDFQDCLILKFGKPRTAIFAHIDSIGFTVKYDHEIVKIGGPRTKQNYILVGADSKGPIECEMCIDEGDQKKIYYKFDREIDRGTELVFKCDFRTSDEYIQSCYLDNRLGCWCALEVAKTLENGIICFSCWEETGGGTAGYMGKYIYEKFGVRQALICDITWITDGVKHGKGVAISMRDSMIPRRKYVDRIIGLMKQSGIAFQLEVEAEGGSDGGELQRSVLPFDWCFIGAAEDNVHTPDEKVHKFDIECMVKAYQYLMQHL